MRFQYFTNSQLPKHIQDILLDGVWFDIEPVEETRTNAQNRCLWGYYYKEAAHAFSLKGVIINVEQFHFFAKTLIPKKKKKCKITGKYRYEERSTTKLSKKQFNQYIESIKIWVWDNLQYSIQDPNSIDELSYYYNQM